MSSILLDIIDAHDIINENQDEKTVLSYIEHLSAQAVLQECSSKNVQTLVSSIHSVLHSKKYNGKRIGLIGIVKL